MQRGVARKLDRQIDTLSQTVKLPATLSAERAARFNDLQGLVAATSDAPRRAALEAQRVPVLQRLDRLVRESEAWITRTARQLDVRRFDVMEQCQERDTRTLLAGMCAAGAHNEPLLRQIWTSCGLGPPDATRLAQVQYLAQGGPHQSRMSEAGAMPALTLLLSGLGLELTSGEGDTIRTSERALFTTTVPVNPPHDIRLAVRQASGLRAYGALFEAAGDAICRASTHQKDWELRAMGPQVGAHTMGYLLGLVWLEREWWDRYQQATALPDGPVQDLFRTAVLGAAVRLRVEGVVMPMVRAALQRAPARIYDGCVKESLDGLAPAKLYARLMQQQLGLKLDPEQALTYVDEMVPHRGALDLDAYLLAHRLLELLRRESDEKPWFLRPEVGQRLVSGLCHAGSAATASQLARHFELKAQPDMEAPWRNFRRSWDALNRQP